MTTMRTPNANRSIEEMDDSFKLLTITSKEMNPNNIYIEKVAISIKTCTI